MRPTHPTRTTGLRPARPVTLAVFMAAMIAPVAMAAATGTQGTFKGFGNSRDPIAIEADNLGVASADQVVTISGNVQVRQKDTTLSTQTLKIFYDQSSAPAPADPGAVGAGQQLRRLEAAGGVKISQPDQTVTGDSGWFDMTSQRAEITGHVVLTQCKNIAKGSRLDINLKTGEYRLEGEQRGDGKRIQLLIAPDDKSSGPAGSSGDGKCR